MKSAALLVWFIALFFANQSNVPVCNCDPASPRQQDIDEATAVFAGQVIYIEEIQAHVLQADGTRPFKPQLEVKFEVEELWKGADNAEFIIRTGVGQGDCGFKFVKGEKYVVYAYGKEMLRTTSCSRTVKLADAAEDLKELGKGKRVKQKS